MNNKKALASKLIAPVLILGLAACSPASTGDDGRAQDTEAVHAVVDRLIEAWRSGDGDAWAREFAEDADFTVWFGMSLKGMEQIAWGHQLIFDSFYADTVFDLGVQQVRFLGDDAAVVHLSGSVLANGEEPPVEPDAVPIAIFQKIAAEWKIVAFQNTPFVVNEFRANGDLKRFKALAAQQAVAPRPASDLPDPLQADWQGQPVCEKLHEDGHNRVLRCTFPAGVGHERHFHAPHFGYAISGGRARITDDNGVREVDLATGSSFASDGVAWHEVINVGDSTIVYLIIEPR